MTTANLRGYGSNAVAPSHLRDSFPDGAPVFEKEIVKPAIPWSTYLFHPRFFVFRFTVLLLICSLTFGGYFSFDMPSVLETQIRDEIGLDSFQYNSLYAAYSLGNCFTVAFGGYLCDKIGYRKSMLIFSSLVVVGQSLFVFGAMVGDYYLMLEGRFVFGMGGGPMSVVQNAYAALYFTGREIALAFALALTVSRLGSVVNFALTEQIESYIGLVWTLAVGLFLCILSFLSGCVLCGVDYISERKLLELGDEDNRALLKGRVISLKDIREFSAKYWILTGICVSFYCIIFPFIAIASQFFQDNYNVSPREGGYLAGIVYDLSLILSPFLGYAVDLIGFRAILLLIASVLTVAIFPLLLWSNDVASLLLRSPLPHSASLLFAVAGMALMGVCYSLIASTLWPSIPAVTSLRVTGSAIGIMMMLQMVGITLTNLIIGFLTDRFSYAASFSVFIILAVITLMGAILLNGLDTFGERTLNVTGKLADWVFGRKEGESLNGDEEEGALPTEDARLLQRSPLKESVVNS